MLSALRGLSFEEEDLNCSELLQLSAEATLLDLFLSPPSVSQDDLEARRCLLFEIARDDGTGHTDAPVFATSASGSTKSKGKQREDDPLVFAVLSENNQPLFYANM